MLFPEFRELVVTDNMVQLRYEYHGTAESLILRSVLPDGCGSWHPGHPGPDRGPVLNRFLLHKDLH